MLLLQNPFHVKLDKTVPLPGQNPIFVENMIVIKGMFILFDLVKWQLTWWLLNQVGKVGNGIGRQLLSLKKNPFGSVDY